MNPFEFLSSLSPKQTVGAVLKPDKKPHWLQYMVAHFQYVLSMGAAFTRFAALYFDRFKMTGLVYPKKIGQINFWPFVF